MDDGTHIRQDLQWTLQNDPIDPDAARRNYAVGFKST